MGNGKRNSNFLPIFPIRTFPGNPVLERFFRIVGNRSIFHFSSLEGVAQSGAPEERAEGGKGFDLNSKSRKEDTKVKSFEVFQNSSLHFEILFSVSSRRRNHLLEKISGSSFSIHANHLSPGTRLDAASNQNVRNFPAGSLIFLSFTEACFIFASFSCFVRRSLIFYKI